MKRIVAGAIAVLTALIVAGPAWAPWETMSALAVNDVTICRNAVSFYLADFEQAPDPAFSHSVDVGFAYTVDPLLDPPEKYSSAVAVTSVPLPLAPVSFPDGVDGVANFTGFSGWVPFSAAQDPNAAAPYDVITLIGGYPDNDDLSADKFYDVGDCYLLPMSVDRVDIGKPDRKLKVVLSSATSPTALSPSDLVVSTIRFGATGTEAAPVRAQVKKSELVLTFLVGETDITCDALTGKLIGQTSDGRQFIGTAELTVQPCLYP
jgi:hypothetical protein